MNVSIICILVVKIIYFKRSFCFYKIKQLYINYIFFPFNFLLLCYSDVTVDGSWIWWRQWRNDRGRSTVHHCGLAWSHVNSDNNFQPVFLFTADVACLTRFGLVRALFILTSSLNLVIVQYLNNCVEVTPVLIHVRL